MEKKYFLGIDTSNYTTSLALVSEGRVVANLKAPLPVKEGECGLRQSDALFAHVKNIPVLAKALREELGEKRPIAVGVSTRPRNCEGSYMPCFLAGVSVAEGIAAALGVPLYSFSHQCGHLRAAIYSSGTEKLLGSPFGAFHVSGGTTEMLYVTPWENGFSVEIVGGTKDLNAGQLVDRVGVMLGLRFPCGPALEALASENTEKAPRRKVKAEDGFVHLSGVENMAQKLFADTRNAPLCADFVLSYIADAIVAMSLSLREKYGAVLPIVYAGGVMSNRRIQNEISQKIQNAHFAEPVFSADNAAGIALLTEERYRKENPSSRH